MDAIVVGRHSGEIPGVNIIETLNITWAEYSGEVITQLQELMNKYENIILQNTPGQVAAALCWLNNYYNSGNLHRDNCHIWVVINKPSTGVEKTVFDGSLYADSDIGNVGEFVQNVLDVANPAASKTLEYEQFQNGGGRVKFYATKPRPFEFSHLEVVYPIF